ncbi:type ISP restriction/modification enzyme [Flavobacterium aquicola]|nr:type ISP restriction/modification enzyme [Flavobacterium aquicola]
MDTHSLYTSTLKLIPSQMIFASAETIPIINPEITKRLENNLGLAFINQKEQQGNICFALSEEVRSEFKETFTAKDVFSFIYALIHSSIYREKQKGIFPADLLDITNQEKFWKLSHLGRDLRKIHFLDNDLIDQNGIQFPIDGDNIVKEIKFEKSTKSVLFSNSAPEVMNYPNENLGKIYINKNQYFDNVPEEVWNFCISDFLPAQKFLNERKEQELTHEDISQYQKIISALTETVLIIKKIDKLVI